MNLRNTNLAAILVGFLLLFSVWYVTVRHERVNSISHPTALTGNNYHLSFSDTLEDVEFCGVTYRAPVVLIDGVDVIQKISQLATENQAVDTAPKDQGATTICTTLKQNYLVGDTLVLTRIGPPYAMEGGRMVYPVELDPLLMFDIATDTNTIFQLGRGDTAYFGNFIPIGHLW
jgi:hypothetical protein